MTLLPTGTSGPLHMLFSMHLVSPGLPCMPLFPLLFQSVSSHWNQHEYISFLSPASPGKSLSLRVVWGTPNTRSFKDSKMWCL